MLAIIFGGVIIAGSFNVKPGSFIIFKTLGSGIFGRCYGSDGVGTTAD